MNFNNIFLLLWRQYSLCIPALILVLILSFKGPEKVNIWIIGDSSAANKKAEVAPETGWGMVLQEFFKEESKYIIML